MKPQIPLDQCALYKCRNKRRLARLLQVSYPQLNDLLNSISYRTKEHEKKDGKTRTIYVPQDQLKRMQSRIKRLLERIEKPGWVFSGTKGRCHVDNGRYHQDSRYFVVTDISSFYDTCTREMVYRFFIDTMQCTPDISECLTNLSAYTTDDKGSLIPTGSPCSQLVAFFAYQSMFKEVEELATAYGCRFSLYVDDLTISSTGPIGNPKKLVKQLNKILRAYGHRLNPLKTRYYRPKESKIITGVALDGRGELHIPNRLGKAVIDDFHDVLSGGDSKAPSLTGRIGAARQIVPSAFPEVERLANEAAVNSMACGGIANVGVT